MYAAIDYIYERIGLRESFVIVDIMSSHHHSTPTYTALIYVRLYVIVIRQILFLKEYSFVVALFLWLVEPVDQPCNVPFYFGKYSL